MTSTASDASELRGGRDKDADQHNAAEEGAGVDYQVLFLGGVLCFGDDVGLSGLEAYIERIADRVFAGLISCAFFGNYALRFGAVAYVLHVIMILLRLAAKRQRVAAVAPIMFRPPCRRSRYLRLGSSGVHALAIMPPKLFSPAFHAFR